MDTKMDWIKQAICSGKTEVFFGPTKESTNDRYRRESYARTICRSCPVMLECRKWARENNELGFWGGESESERWRNGFLVNKDYARRESSRLRRVASAEKRRAEARDQALAQTEKVQSS